jgi:hypothetical protein
MSSGQRADAAPTVRWAASLVVLALTAAGWLWIRHHAPNGHGPTAVGLPKRAIALLVVLSKLAIAILWLPIGLWLSLQIVEKPIFERLRRSAVDRWIIPVALPLTCCFLAWFIFHFGNRQFGAWDFNIVTDTGWRQMLGQRAYVDFVTPNPPVFNLGIYYAFRLFGVSWNAQLAWTILASIVTFLWTFVLCRGLSMRTTAAWFTALLLQGLTFLPTDFWWYNSSTAMLGCIFLLSMYLCVKRSDYSSGPWTSYAVSLALLSLDKPNTAGLLISGGVVLLLVAAPAPRWKMLLWTASGAVLAILLLRFNHVSVMAMIASYRAVAVERGGFHAFALHGLWPAEKIACYIIPALCSAILLSSMGPLRQAVPRSNWRYAAGLLMLLLPIPAAFYGIGSNADFREMESAVLLTAAATAAFALRITRPAMRSLLVATGVALFFSLLLAGVKRDRVMGIGKGEFWEETDNRTPIRDGFFTNLTATPRMQRVQEEAHRAAATLPKPMFLGPRLEFDYADLRLPSPRNWPVYYQPGTSFRRSDIGRLNQVWAGAHFGTLMFLGDDRTFLPDDLLETIDRDYQRVPGYGELEVYVWRQP